MTALPSRRRKRSLVMLLVTVLTLAAVPVLGYVGARAILDSEGGTDALADNLPIVPFPSTPTALLATTDGAGRLTSTTVLVLDPSGLGGSIISVPVNADIGFSDDARQSLQGAYATGGLEATVAGVESLLRISLNFATEMTPDQTAALLDPFEPIHVDLPVGAPADDAHDAIPAGESELDAAGAAHVLTALPADGELEVSRRHDIEALWVGVVTAVGDGAVDGPVDAAATPTSFTEVATHLFAGTTQTRGLSAQALTAEQNPTGIDVEQVDRAEAVFVFASISPGAVFAVAEGPRIRLVAPPGYDPQVKRTIEVLLVVQANVVSVDTTAEPVEGTVFYVPDDFMMNDATLTADFFGEVEFGSPTERIDGVDITVVMGTTYLDGVEV